MIPIKESKQKFRFRTGENDEQCKLRYHLLLQKAKGMYFLERDTQRMRKSFVRIEQHDFSVFHVERKNTTGKLKCDN